MSKRRNFDKILIFLMLTYGELFVLVAAGGLVLGKKDIVAASRILGSSIGKLVGSLQGLSIKYEEATKGSRLRELHRDVRQGINELNAIRSDFALLGRNNIYASPQKGACVV